MECKRPINLCLGSHLISKALSFSNSLPNAADSNSQPLSESTESAERRHGSSSKSSRSTLMRPSKRPRNNRSYNSHWGHWRNLTHNPNKYLNSTYHRRLSKRTRPLVRETAKETNGSWLTAHGSSKLQRKYPIMTALITGCLRLLHHKKLGLTYNRSVILPKASAPLLPHIAR